MFLLIFIHIGSVPVSAQAPAPSGLSVLPPYDGQVNLQWTPDVSETPAETAYAVSRELVNLTCSPTPTSTGPITPIPTCTPIATVLLSAMPSAGTPVYQDFQVTNGRFYLYQVQGIDVNGPGTAASVTMAPFLAPAAVQPVSVLNIHSNALDLFWGVPVSSFPVSFYQVYRYEYIATTAMPTPTFTNSPTITPTITSTPTGTWNTSTATSTPTPFTPTPTATTAFSTTPPVSVATILTNATPVATVFGTTYSDLFSTPTGAEAYYYVVMAVDSDTPGNLSAQPTLPSNPALPQNMAPPGPPILTGVLSTSSYGVSLSWTGSLSSEQVTAYQVLQNGVTLATIPYSNSGTVTYFDNTVPGTGLPVTYIVQATNNFGTTPSNSIFVTVVECNEGGIQVTPNATTNAVTITWQPATAGFYGLGGYQVYKSLYGVPTANSTPVSGETATPTPFYAVTFNPTVGFTITPVIDSPIINHMNYWVQPMDSSGHGGVVGVAFPPALNLAPTPPSNVGAAAPVGNDQIAVSWTAGAPGFYGSTQNNVIFRLNFTTPTPTPRFIAKVPASQLSYNDIAPELTPGTLIGYQVELSDALGNTSDASLSSNGVNTSALTNPPATPRVLPFTGTVNSIVFSWANNPRADCVTNYQVYGFDWLTPVPLTPTPVLVVPVTGSPTFVFTFAPTPTPWAPNDYYLVAQNSIGNSQPATMNGIPVPTYNVTAVIPTGTQQVSVSWNLVPALTVTPVIDSYGVYRSLTPDAKFTSIATVPISSTSYLDVPPIATAGVTYYYRITARSGQSAESPILFPTMTPDPQASLLIWPNAPSGVTALSSSYNQTTLYWAGNASQEGVTGYSIYLDGSPTPVATVAAYLSPSPTVSYIAQETPGNLSYYSVQANNPSGGSNLSQSVSVLVPPAITPGINLTPPLYVSPTPNQTPAFSPGVWITGMNYFPSMTPTWVTGYSIYRLSVPTPSTTPTFVSVGSVAAPVSYFEDTGFVPGYVNYYQVVASNTGLGISANPAVSAQLGVTLWPEPPNFTFTGNATSVTLSFATPTGNNVAISGYDIYRSLYPTTTPNPTPYAQITPPISTYSDSGVSTGTAYIYWMDAQNSQGNSGYSAPQSFIPVPVPTLYLTPLPERNQLFWAPITVATASPVTGYAVYRAAVPTPSLTPNFAQIGSIVEPISNTNYVDTTVTDGVSYIYEIAPSSQNNMLGPFSNTVTQYVYPQPVTNFIAVSGDDLVQLRWAYQGIASNTVYIQRKLAGPWIYFPNHHNWISGREFHGYRCCRQKLLYLPYLFRGCPGTDLNFLCVGYCFAGKATNTPNSLGCDRAASDIDPERKQRANFDWKYTLLGRGRSNGLRPDHHVSIGGILYFKVIGWWRGLSKHCHRSGYFCERTPHGCRKLLRSGSFDQWFGLYLFSPSL